MLAVLEEGLLMMLFDLKYIDSAIRIGFREIAECARRGGEFGKNLVGGGAGIRSLARAGDTEQAPS